MRKLLIISLLATFGWSCTTTKKISKKSPYDTLIDTSAVLSQGFSGLMLYDLEKNQPVYERNAHRYFTPASNTKLFTLYASLKTLGDSIPALKYKLSNDSLVFWGTGDPTFLHPDLANTKAFDFLKANKSVKRYYFSDGNFTNEYFGLGWMWDDYNDYYSPEISPLPMYGNILRVKIKNKEIELNPAIFQNSIYPKKETSTYIKRAVHDNQFLMPQNLAQSADYEQDIPYKTSTALTQQLLMDTLKKNINILPIPVDKNAKTLYSTTTDPILRKMMQESDNMLAEHLLMLCGSTIKDSLNTNFVIKYITEKYLQDLPDKSDWVDGSGISRYNLFTPRSIVKLLQKMHAEIPQERLFSLMAIGGQAGTTRSMFKADKPYVFAKSGSMGGVYNLSGYMLTKQDKVLLFSFMNNNSTHSSSRIRKEVEKILTWVHENY
jgi:serine-type D-Ala-D-Ala carboxypeptidase/endopeptidase (penicillin-binding protein 4)